MVTRIGWLSDKVNFIGGTELSAATLLRNKPEWAEIVPCPPRKRPPDVDAFIIQNCTQYTQRWIEELALKPVIKQIRDPWFAGDVVLRRWLIENSRLLIFNSVLQLAKFGYDIGNTPRAFVPPPVDLQAFRDAAIPESERSGAVFVGRVGPTKGYHLAIDWAMRSGATLDMYGEILHPVGRLPGNVRIRGPIPYQRVPYVMGRAKYFVFMPTWVESFGRVVAEAWAAGCELVLGGDIGAVEWIEGNPEALEDGVGMFWGTVKEALNV